MMWSVSYWLGIAGAVILLIYFGVYPLIPVLIALFSIPLFLAISFSNRDDKNDPLPPRHRGPWDDDDDGKE